VELTWNDDQRALRDVVAAVSAQVPGPADRARDDTVARTAATTLRRELSGIGAWTIAAPDEHGGGGAALTEVCVIAETLGLAVAPLAYVDSAAGAARLLSASVAAGSLAATHALQRWSRDEIQVVTPVARPVMTSRETADGWEVTGTVEVASASDAPTALLLVDEAAGELFLVGPDDLPTPVTATGVDRLPSARHRLVGVPATPLGVSGADLVDLCTRADADVAVARAFEGLGLMETALRLTTAHLRTREQFGRPLSAFQDLTFRAADLYMAIELSRSVATWALARLVEEDCSVAGATEAADRAALTVVDAARLVAKETIQLHGAIGLTSEHDISHTAARLTTLSVRLGRRDDLLRTLGEISAAVATVDALA
jgi:alkylation response protein AidB-like acyl-CoA dehydrogenase